ncbi:hypothetical protein N7495_002182 [Penicillium taxi]|uniref:uncharacterized protein n=1 Tax=Penicillium taxi TaxID=168475 RepID=UPI002544FADD|nr:uncharacterized protein N7495_002182 [Penicillium taxi]KAJ5901654.1 hypothetical protein N7495_002182 [Penicillium taxi]
MIHESLHGSCACGRNHYSIQIPSDVADHAVVYFDSSQDNRQIHGAPLTAWLRVPLGWYQSYTESFFPDETHTSIRRTFTPRHAPETQRIFCGYCGTHLTCWTENPREESEFMSIAIGSLLGEDLHALEELNLLPGDLEETPQVDVKTSAVIAPSNSSASTVIVPSFDNQNPLSRSFRYGKSHGIPWFEEMVEGSRLGRHMRAKRGKGLSDDNTTTIEWEISEWQSDDIGEIAQDDSDSNGRSTGKRKRGSETSLKA